MFLSTPIINTNLRGPLHFQARQTRERWDSLSRRRPQAAGVILVRIRLGFFALSAPVICAVQRSRAKTAHIPIVAEEGGDHHSPIPVWRPISFRGSSTSALGIVGGQGCTYLYSLILVSRRSFRPLLGNDVLFSDPDSDVRPLWAFQTWHLAPARIDL